LIDANKAVLAAQTLAGGGPPPTPAPGLNGSPGTLDFGPSGTQLELSITNNGTGVLNVTSITASQPWVTVTPTTGPTPLRVTVTINRAGLPVGTNPAQLAIATAEGQSKNVGVTARVEAGGAKGDVGTVFVLAIGADGKVVAQTDTTLAKNYNYSIPDLPAGTYRVVAGTDRDNDDLICETVDACGEFPNPVTVAAGGAITVNIAIENFATREPTGIALTGSAQKRQ
jgi:serine protease